MGQAQSNNNSSEVDTLNWSDVNTEGMTEGYKVNKNKNGIEIIDIDFGLMDSESESETLDNVFQKLHDITQPNLEENNLNNVNAQKTLTSDSSPFISTDMYNKIMQGGNNNDSSPFVNTEVYNNIMKGGHLDDDSSSSESDDSDDSTSDSEILRALSEISLTSEDKPKKSSKKNKHHNKHSKGLSTSSAVSELNNKAYGFSNTSSEMIKTSENNYYINNNNTSDTPYKMDSSSINTSDINLISVDSRNGRRFL